MIKKLLRGLGMTAMWLVGLVAAAWSVGALYFDFPWAALRVPMAVVFALALVFAMIVLRGSWRRLSAIGTGFVVVLTWWLTISPSNDRAWPSDVAELGWAEINGDDVVLHNIRNCDYRTETDYTPHWDTRTVHMSKLTGVDVALTYWGSPWIAHPIASFQFSDAPPICFSIETRKHEGQTYSAIAGFYRQYELIYTMADERDVIRVRTNYREGEDVYLYRLRISPERTREMFREYLATMNQLRTQPRWYNAVTMNCTTSIRHQSRPSERRPFDWRLLLNGKSDEMLYQRGDLLTGGLSFPELKAHSYINPLAKDADQSPDFSKRIREKLVH